MWDNTPLHIGELEGLRNPGPRWDEVFIPFTREPERPPAEAWQREELHKWSMGVPDHLRVHRYWTREEIEDPKLTYRSAELGIKELKRFHNNILYQQQQAVSRHNFRL